MAPPIPVPSVSMTTSRLPRAAPAQTSASSAALASCSNTTFDWSTPRLSATSALNGTFFHPKFEVLMTIPFTASTKPGEQIPNPVTSCKFTPALCTAALVKLWIRSAVSRGEHSTPNFPEAISPWRAALSSTTPTDIVVPPRSMPTKNSPLPTSCLAAMSSSCSGDIVEALSCDVSFTTMEAPGADSQTRLPQIHVSLRSNDLASSNRKSASHPGSKRPLFFRPSASAALVEAQSAAAATLQPVKAIRFLKQLWRSRTAPASVSVPNF
mmetsp:Transcript_77312/g.122068  ORF Transcript_77312/g.122068 Transcript_77312/m.122068 type:complete len:268 (+) Transcript_77312:1503-2306(+)